MVSLYFSSPDFTVSIWKNPPLPSYTEPYCITTSGLITLYTMLQFSDNHVKSKSSVIVMMMENGIKDWKPSCTLEYDIDIRKE